MKCPKCGHERTKQDDDIYPKTECPKCGVIYSRVNIKQVKEEAAQKNALEETEQKKEFAERQDKRIQQLAVKINSMSSGQRIEAIREMFQPERAVFLQAESTHEALKGMSYFQRNKYLYGTLLLNPNRQGLVAFFNIAKGVVIGIPFMVAAIYGLKVYVDSERASQLPPGLMSRTSNSGIVKNSEWDGSVSQVKSYIKANAKDPKSLKFISWSPVTETDNGFLVRVKYRAKNSFGALVVEEKLFLLNSSGTIVKWSNY